jgi:predicted metal-binding protein
VKENSMEETIKQLKLMLKVRKEQKEIIECAGGSCMNCNPDIKALSESIDILSDYKRVLKENEELKISNKEIDKECSRLEKKEVELINENEHYEDLIYALKTYYGITEEDLEKCMKNDR